jgi:thioredoxin
MNKLKKNVLLVIITICSIALSAQQAQQTAQEKQEQEQEQKQKQKQKQTVEIKHLTEAEFIKKVYDVNAGAQAVSKSKKPVIIDFYADWCGPCKRLAPHLEQALVDYKGKIEIYKVNVDKEKALAQKFNVRSIPLLLFFPAKGKPEQVLGFRPKEEIYKLIDKLLLKN